MFSSIRTRLWLSYAALIVAALGVVTIVLVIFLLRNPYLYRQTFVRLTAAENVLLDAPRATGRLDTVAQAFGVRVLLMDGSGNLIEDSSSSAAPLRTTPSVITGRSLSTVRDTVGRLWFYSRARQADGTWLLVAAPRPRLLPALGLLTDDLSLPLLEGAIISLLLSLVLAYFLARWIGDPLQRLVSAAHGVSSVARAKSSMVDSEPAPGGEIDTRQVPEAGPREVRALTHAFNAMLTRVESSRRSQRDFVANVSHELKTPLTSIQGFAQALLDGAAESPEARRQAAQVIYDEAGRMHRLALDLLDLARLDSGTAELRLADVDVSRLLEGIVDKFRPLSVAAGVGLESSVASDLPPVNGDGDRLAQVFTNLVDNAIKFTPRGGKIGIRAAPDRDGLEVVVEDTGPGIRPEDLPHVFDRFFQADEARTGGEAHGAGLGLAIAREIVLAHGGKIRVRSAEGQGAAFSVSLPVSSHKRG
jgi:signal transduction histidine kinase